MGKKTHKELSPEVRWKIVGAHEFGATAATIAKAYGLPLSTVYVTIDRYKRTGSAQPKKRPGRPPSLNARDQRVVKRVVLAGRRQALGEITNAVNNRLNTKLSPETVRKYMAKEGFSNRKASKNPLLKKRTPKPGDSGA
jgi:transposase